MCIKFKILLLSQTKDLQNISHNYNAYRNYISLNENHELNIYNVTHGFIIY